MDNETLFYACGIIAAVSAVVFSFAGLKLKNFPGKAFPIVVIWFVVFVGGAATFSVLHAQDEEAEKALEFEEANEEIEAAEGSEPFEEEEAEQEAGGEEAAGGEGEAEPAEEGGASAGGASTLQLAADPTALAYDTDSLEAEAGEVTIDFDNPAAIEHDVAIDQDGSELAKSETITEGKTSVTTELEPGDYTFLCTVPGHAAAGMEGTLTVK
jgi:plastocyanin